MAWPQIVWLVLAALGLGMYAAKHGQPRTDSYSFWAALFATAINAYILYAGGFFG